jgi:hypothetical protein
MLTPPGAFVIPSLPDGLAPTVRASGWLTDGNAPCRVRSAVIERSKAMRRLRWGSLAAR